ncbi:MAG: hypothetical protein IJ086_07055 [Clostridium sp.]|nr:hypothetical protein [Clostridium sp.]
MKIGNVQPQVNEDIYFRYSQVSSGYIKKSYKHHISKQIIEEEKIFYKHLPSYFKKYFAKPVFSTRVFCIYECPPLIEDTYSNLLNNEYDNLACALSLLNYDFDQLLSPKNIGLEDGHIVILNYSSMLKNQNVKINPF